MKKLNNKGFTLIELIIVIAIIAILAAVLAPQYLQYVERSRQSNDLQTATAIVDAVTIAAGDPDVKLGGDETVTWAVAGGALTFEGDNTEFENAVTAIIDSADGMTSAVADEALEVSVTATGEISVAGAPWITGGELEISIG